MKVLFMGPTMFVIVGKRLFTFPDFVSPVRQFMVDLLPRPYAVGFMCCDHPGESFGWHLVWTWNKWHAGRVYDRKDYCSDGTYFHPVPFTTYFKNLISKEGA